MFELKNSIIYEVCRDFVDKRIIDLRKIGKS